MFRLRCRTVSAVCCVHYHYNKHFYYNTIILSLATYVKMNLQQEVDFIAVAQFPENFRWIYDSRRDFVLFIIHKACYNMVR